MIIIIIDGRWSENGFMDILKDWMGLIQVFKWILHFKNINFNKFCISIDLLALCVNHKVLNSSFKFLTEYNENI